MSVLGEISFFTGPLLAGILIAVGSPTLAVAGAAVLAAGGTLALATAPAVHAVPASEGRGSGRLAALDGGAIRYIVAAGGLFGITFGVLDVAWPAFAHNHGSTATAGLFLSLFAVGAGIGGLLYGARQHNAPAISTYSALCLLAAAGLTPLIAADSIQSWPRSRSSQASASPRSRPRRSQPSTRWPSRPIGPRPTRGSEPSTERAHRLAP